MVRSVRRLFAPWVAALGFAAWLGSDAFALTPAPAKELRLPFGLDWNVKPKAIVERLRASGATSVQEDTKIIFAEGLRHWGAEIEMAVVESTPEGVASITLSPKSGTVRLAEVIGRLRDEHGEPEVAPPGPCTGPWMVWRFGRPESFIHVGGDDSSVMVVFVHAERVKDTLLGGR